MMGSRANAPNPNTGSSTAGLKRKRDIADLDDPTPTGATTPSNNTSDDVPTSTEYFFAKFLTSPLLLDLELADTHFRRQVLFQLLILLTHLLTFTKSAKATWVTQRNRSLHMDFTLEADDEKWVTEMVGKAQEEMRQTAPGGRAFADTVAVILERERNWVKWKNDNCMPFDKPPWSTKITLENGQEKEVGLEESTRAERHKLMTPPAPWSHRLGTAPLTEIWEMGYRELWDLQNPFQ
jgi:hypothetical protein